MSLERSKKCYRVGEAGKAGKSEGTVKENGKRMTAFQQCLEKGCGPDDTECLKACSGEFGDFYMMKSTIKCLDKYGNVQERSQLINNKCNKGIVPCMKDILINIFKQIPNIASGSDKNQCRYVKIHTTQGAVDECKESTQEGYLVCDDIKEIPAEFCINGACLPGEDQGCGVDCSKIEEESALLDKQDKALDAALANIKSGPKEKIDLSKCNLARAKLEKKRAALEKKRKEKKRLEKAGFRNKHDLEGSIYDMPQDPIIKLYYSSIGLLMLYILLRVLNK